MRIVVIGGSGRVGTGVLPFLAKEHDVVNFDVRPPAVPAGRYVEGSVFDMPRLSEVLREADGLVSLILGSWPPSIDSSYDMNVKAVHCILQAALDAGRTHVVHASSVSVHNEGKPPFLDEETHPLDAEHIYGLTKGLGEQVCRWFCRVHGMSILALRLYAPVSREKWLEQCRKQFPNGYTTHSDVARAFAAAAAMKGHEGFDAAYVAGDHTGAYVNSAKAKRLFGWEPLDRFEPGTV